MSVRSDWYNWQFWSKSHQKTLLFQMSWIKYNETSWLADEEGFPQFGAWACPNLKVIVLHVKSKKYNWQFMWKKTHKALIYPSTMMEYPYAHVWRGESICWWREIWRPIGILTGSLHHGFLVRSKQQITFSNFFFPQKIVNIQIFIWDSVLKNAIKCVQKTGIGTVVLKVALWLFRKHEM